MLEVDDEGNNATLGEHVTDEEYNAASPEWRTAPQAGTRGVGLRRSHIVAEREPAGTATTCLLWTTRGRDGR
jgi:hypothetical protein